MPELPDFYEWPEATWIKNRLNSKLRENDIDVQESYEKALLLEGEGADGVLNLPLVHNLLDCLEGMEAMIRDRGAIEGASCGSRDAGRLSEIPGRGYCTALAQMEGPTTWSASAPRDRSAPASGWSQS